MIIIGLTGSIGMGKSTTAQMLEEMGYPCYDADAEIHKIMAPGGVAVPQIKHVFEQAVETNDQGQDFVNRQTLGQIVFNDAEKLQQLEDILYPIIKKEEQSFLTKHREKGVDFVVLDIPLLFEKGGDKRVDVTFCVTATKEIQRQRVLSRPGMTEDKFTKILNSQMPDAEKQKRADFVVYTDKSKKDTHQQLCDIIALLQRDKIKWQP